MHLITVRVKYFFTYWITFLVDGPLQRHETYTQSKVEKTDFSGSIIQIDNIYWSNLSEKYNN